MSQKKNEGILFPTEIRVVGSYTDRLLKGNHCWYNSFCSLRRQDHTKFSLQQILVVKFDTKLMALLNDAIFVTNPLSY